MQPMTRPENHSARRINALAARLKAKTYLEIGVARGRTFHAVKVPQKVGVDPEFLFPAGEFTTPSVKFFECTSDAFFDTCPAAWSFDLIFIDGLHTAQQTILDFLRSIVHSHERTVWIIDDTVPCDEFSALPTQKEAIAARAAAGGGAGAPNAWHGDVFKVPFLIRNLMPEFRFVTATTGGNPQTLVWREYRALPPAPMTREQILGLTYVDFLDLQHQLNPISEEAALQAAGDGVCA
jgi:hypothetical protein